MEEKPLIVNKVSYTQLSVYISMLKKYLKCKNNGKILNISNTTNKLLPPRVESV